MINKTRLFSDPAVPYPDLSDSLPFSEYIEQCKMYIKKTRVDLETQADVIIAANAPFEGYPKDAIPGKKIKYGALLIHGLLDSPFTMRDIGNELQNEGLLVRSVLLPGHGTVPGALLHVHYLQWVNTIRYAITTLSTEVEHIFLVGYSTGGTLALYSQTHSATIAGIICLAPALKINCPLDFAAKVPTTIGSFWPRLAWFYRDPYEKDYARYHSTPFNAVYQVYQLTKKVNLNQIVPLNCPLLFVLPANDVTVLSKASIRYFIKNSHTENRMILYDKTKINAYNDKRIIVRNSQYPEKHIVDFSHLSLPFKPDNPHYGMEGDCVEASRIGRKDMLYGEFYPSMITLHNTLYQLKCAHYQYNRLTYNPDFAWMSQQIKEFIMTVG